MVSTNLSSVVVSQSIIRDPNVGGCHGMSLAHVDYCEWIMDLPTTWCWYLYWPHLMVVHSGHGCHFGSLVQSPTLLCENTALVVRFVEPPFGRQYE
jgi:hypothetical protein